MAGARVVLVIVDFFVVFGLDVQTTWSEVLSNLVFASIPIAIGVAVLRYRLYRIDLIIDRALVYAQLLAVVAGLSAAIVPLSQRGFIAVTGGESDATIVLTALFAAAIVTPLKKRLESMLERRFKPTPATADAPAAEARTEELLQHPEFAAAARLIAEEAARNALERSRGGGARGP